MSNPIVSRLFAEAEPVALAYVQVTDPEIGALSRLLVAYLDERVNAAHLDDPFAEIAEQVTDTLIAEAVTWLLDAVLDAAPVVLAEVRLRALEWMQGRPDRVTARKRARAKRRALRIARRLERRSDPLDRPPGHPDALEA